MKVARLEGAGDERRSGTLTRAVPSRRSGSRYSGLMYISCPLLFLSRHHSSPSSPSPSPPPLYSRPPHLFSYFSCLSCSLFLLFLSWVRFISASHRRAGLGPISIFSRPTADIPRGKSRSDPSIVKSSGFACATSQLGERRLARCFKTIGPRIQKRALPGPPRASSEKPPTASRCKRRAATVDGNRFRRIDTCREYRGAPCRARAAQNPPAAAMNVRLREQHV